MTNPNEVASPKKRILPILLFLALFIPAFAGFIWLKSYLRPDTVDISQLTRPHVGWNCKEWIDGSRSNRMVDYRFYPANDGYPTFQWWLTEGEGSIADKGFSLLFSGGYKLTGTHIRFVTSKNVKTINRNERVFNNLQPLNNLSADEGDITRLTGDSLYMTLVRGDSKFKFECSSVVHDDSAP